MDTCIGNKCQKHELGRHYYYGIGIRVIVHVYIK